MNYFREFFKNNSGNECAKWDHYLDVYDMHFKRFQKQDKVVILEIGVDKGGSLEMWKYYFKGKVDIYGVDINPFCKSFEADGIKIFIGSQADKKFLKQLKQAIPKVDILIDDGGHTMQQQLNTFEILFDHVKDNGVYLCEDLHTSYWLFYGGGYRRRGTFIEFSKRFIDQINAWYSEQSGLKVDDLTKSIKSLHYYDSVLVIEKGKQDRGKIIKSGENRLVSDKVKSEYFWSKFRLKGVIKWFISAFNKLLRAFRLPSFLLGGSLIDRYLVKKYQKINKKG